MIKFCFVDRPKISDFGLVRLTGEGDFGLSVDQTNTLMGTPLYMAPEAGGPHFIKLILKNN